MNSKLQSIIVLVSIACAMADDPVLKGIAVLQSSTVNGIVRFEQSGAVVTVNINITGLTPAGDHGFHIHASGDLSNGCTSAGAHFNPAGATHGAPTDAVRHVGDLGNIVADSYGNVIKTLNDTQIKLSGVNSIIGRAVVVHQLQDDLGRGTGEKAADSKTTGNAGARLTCAVIGIV